MEAATMATVTFTWKNANKMKVGSEADATYEVKGEREAVRALAYAAHVEAPEGRRFGMCNDKTYRRLCSADFIEVVYLVTVQ